MNLVIGSAAECQDTKISLNGTAVDDKLIVEVVNHKCSVDELEARDISFIC
jgi:hypothetical protein